LDDFYEHPKMKDGHLGKCKQCAKDDSNARRAEKLESVRAYDRERAQNPARKAAVRRYVRARNLRYPQKRKARIAVGNAIRDGLLVKLPCVRCGDENVEAHHHDYSKPLEVIWLCYLHHREIHAEIKQQAISMV